MEMRKFFAVVGLVALFVAPTMATEGFGNGSGYDGGQVFFEQIDGYHFHYGGEFTIYNYDDTKLGVDLAKYADTTKNISYVPSFQTFCVELSDNFYSGSQVWVSEAFLDGTPGSHSYSSYTSSGVDLNPRTAYLYTEFAKGTLDGYIYDPEEGRAESAAALQEAIWYLQSQPYTKWTSEGEIIYAFDPENLSEDAQYFVTLAENSGWETIGNVRVMQMYNLNAADPLISSRQDMLVIVPTPGAILLAGIGTTLIGMLRRRKAM